MDAAIWLSDFSRELLRPEGLDRLVARTDDEIASKVPQVADDESIRRDLHASTRAHWQGFLTALARRDFEPSIPPEPFDLALTIARRGLDLTVLLSVYRVAQRSVWTYITDFVERNIADVELRSAVLVRFWERVTIWLDTSIEQLIAAYTTEREQLQRGSIARRSETIRAILRGDPFDLDRASEELGYRLRGSHTAVVLWADDDLSDADVQRALEDGAATLATSARARQRLMTSSGARSVWCWLSGAATLTGTVPAGINAAVGMPGLDADGFVRSHREALAVQRLATAVRRPAAVSRYSDVEIACLASGLTGSAGAAAFVERELGPLAGTDETMSRLRETLRAYYEFDGNAGITGKKLALHPNTVRYRIRQAEELLGHEVGTRRVHVETALHLLAAFGSADALVN